MELDRLHQPIGHLTSQLADQAFGLKMAQMDPASVLGAAVELGAGCLETMLGKSPVHVAHAFTFPRWQSQSKTTASPPSSRRRSKMRSPK